MYEHIIIILRMNITILLQFETCDFNAVSLDISGDTFHPKLYCSVVQNICIFNALCKSFSEYEGSPRTSANMSVLCIVSSFISITFQYI
jgi:hypothetical protein